MANLFDRFAVGALTLKNRIVMSSVANDLATERGEVTDALIAHYTRRAAGVGLVVVEHSHIAIDGRLSPRQLGICDDFLIQGLRKLARSIQEKGTPTCIQVGHAGRKSRRSVCGTQSVAPSPIAASDVDEVPRELERDEIRRLVRLFREAVRRAYEAEFDALEIHGGHGFLLDQFTSPLSNRRTDEYGGSFDNRIRFPLEVVEGIRKTVGSGFLLFYNLGGYSGTSLSESEAFARRLVQAGVSIIDVSGNLIGSRPDGMLSQECALPLAEKIKQAVQVPVVGGGIKDPQIADAAIRQGRVDLVGVSGAMLADPDWAAKAAEVLGYKAYSYWGWATKAKQC